MPRAALQLDLAKPQTNRFSGWRRHFVIGFKVSLLSLLSIAGCQVGPNFRQPTAPTPEIWQTDASGITFVQGGVRREVQWWRTLGEAPLEPIVARLMTENFSLKEAAHRIQEARAQRRATITQRFPTLSADAGYSYRRFSQNGNAFVPQADATSGFDLISNGLDLSWEVDVWGRVKRLEEAADADIAREQELLADLRIMLVAEACTTFIEARVLQHRLMIAEANRQLQQETVDLTLSRERAGLSSLLDVHQATTQLRLTESTIPALDAKLRTATYRLCVLQGLPPMRDPLAIIGEGPIPAPPTQLYSGIPADLLRKRPDVRAAEEKVHADSAKIGVAEADLYPQLSVNGSISVESRTSSELFTQRSLSHDIGPSLKWNVFQFGKVRASIVAAQMRYEQSLDAYRQTVLEGYEEVENALVEIESNRLESEYLAGAVQEARFAYELAIAEYERGILAFQTVLDAERQLLAAQDQWAVVRGDQLSAVVALYRAMGGGWESPTIANAADAAQHHIQPQPIAQTPASDLSTLSSIAPVLPRATDLPSTHTRLTVPSLPSNESAATPGSAFSPALIEAADPLFLNGSDLRPTQIVPSYPQRSQRRLERMPIITELGFSLQSTELEPVTPLWQDLGRTPGTVYAAESITPSPPSLSNFGSTVEPTTDIVPTLTLDDTSSRRLPDSQNVIDTHLPAPTINNPWDSSHRESPILRAAPRIDRLPALTPSEASTEPAASSPTHQSHSDQPASSDATSSTSTRSEDSSAKLPTYPPVTIRSAPTARPTAEESHPGTIQNATPFTLPSATPTRDDRQLRLERLPASDSTSAIMIPVPGAEPLRVSVDPIAAEASLRRELSRPSVPVHVARPIAYPVKRRQARTPSTSIVPGLPANSVNSESPIDSPAQLATEQLESEIDAAPTIEANTIPAADSNEIAAEITSLPSTTTNTPSGLDDYWRPVVIPQLRLHGRAGQNQWSLEPQGTPSLPFLAPIGSGLTPREPQMQRLPSVIQRLPATEISAPRRERMLPETEASESKWERLPQVAP